MSKIKEAVLVHGSLLQHLLLSLNSKFMMELMPISLKNKFLNVLVVKILAIKEIFMKVFNFYFQKEVLINLHFHILLKLLVAQELHKHHRFVRKILAASNCQKALLFTPIIMLISLLLLGYLKKVLLQQLLLLMKTS